MGWGGMGFGGRGAGSKHAINILSIRTHYHACTFHFADICVGFQQLRKIRGFPTPPMQTPLHFYLHPPHPPMPPHPTPPHPTPLPGLDGRPAAGVCLRAPGFKMLNWSSEGFIERLCSDPQAYTWNGLRLQPAFQSVRRSRPGRLAGSLIPSHGNIFD